MMYPAKRLPISKRLIELIRRGLFSLILTRVGNRGCPRSAKNTGAVNSCERGGN